MRVLVTRPEPGASATARRLAARGHQAVLAPLAAIVPVPAELPLAEAIQAVVVTSANALPALAAFRARPLLTVGDATAAAARAAGFTDVASAHGDGAALAALAIARCDPAGAALLLPSQEGQGAALAGRLRAAGFAVCHRAVYALRPVCVLPEPARRALDDGAVDAALFFSPGSAHRFVMLAGVLRPACFARVESFAISPATATALAPLPWQRIRVARAPDQDELLGLLP